VAKIRWIALAVVCMSLTVIGIDNTILNVALPTLSHPVAAGGLGASGSQLQWMVDSYTIVFAGLLLTGGSLGDRFGRYRFLSLGLIVFGIGSVASAFASSSTMLICTRAVMGIGAAAIMPATLSIIANIFTEPRERAKAIGVWAGVVAVGIGIGPVIGGFLLEHFWWGSVFLVNVPVVIFGLVLGYLFVPESRDASAPPLDPLGSILSIVGVAALLYAVIEGPSDGWGSPAVVAGFVVGAAVLAAFGWWELHTEYPMLDLRFFENPRFSAASSAITLTFLALFGFVFLLTQYLQLVLDYSTVEAGAVLLPMTTVMMVFAPLSPRWVRRFGNKRVVAFGMATASVGFLLMVTLDAHTSVLHLIAVTLFLGFGMAHVMAPATDSVMGAVPREKAGVGSAMNDTTRQFGGAVGVAVIGSIAASVFSSHLRSDLHGVVPPATLHSATDSLGAAIGVAQHAPPGVRDQIVTAAQSSFVSAMHVAVVVGTAILVLGVFIVVKWLPARAHDDEPLDIDIDTVAAPVSLAAGPADVVPVAAVADVAEVADALNLGAHELEHERT
jgi:EmrB/QacA subfamily drug resistance transporter